MRLPPPFGGDIGIVSNVLVYMSLLAFFVMVCKVCSVEMFCCANRISDLHFYSTLVDFAYGMCSFMHDFVS
jgi:hypothetical protein